MEDLGELEEIWTCNNRVVPQPQKWNELYGRLKNTRRKPGGGFDPPLPLILAAWWESSDFDKRNRLRDHLRWAIEQNQVDEILIFLQSLKESDWVHEGEI